MCICLPRFAIFFDAKKTATKETVAVENFINQSHRFGNDYKLKTDPPTDGRFFRHKIILILKSDLILLIKFPKATTLPMLASRTPYM